MADPVVIPDDTAREAEDVAMEGDNVVAAVNAEAEADGDAPPDLDVIDAPARTAFVEYLKSPIVELLIGSGDQATSLTAHQDLLTHSPYFEQACAEFTSNSRRIELPDEDIDAVGSFIEYLYRGDYFPRNLDSALETDPSLPPVDEKGDYLLKHARIYTLAEKFKLPELKSLSHAKIHKTTSTARGEIAYARYVYEHTDREDKVIRRPVAAFWATRSHVLRHEAEEEFRAMCLEFPQFGFDVLSMVLDQKEKRQGGGGGVSAQAGAGAGPSVSVDTPGRGRKRARVSGV